jgi:hypothetical protein
MARLTSFRAGGALVFAAAEGHEGIDHVRVHAFFAA